MTKSIALTQGKFAIVDDEDYEWINQWKWYYHRGYAKRASNVIPGKQTRILMHALIAQTPPGMGTDHANANRLDNRRKNLRVCTKSENGRNRGKQRDNTSGYKGVFFQKRAKNRCWFSQIRVNGNVIYLGSYENIVDAAMAYDNAAKKYHGKFAKTNLDNS